VIKNNRITVDLNKCQYARFGYRNQYDQFRNTKPKFSVHGNVRDPNEKVWSKSETLKQFADAAKITDVWHPEVTLQLTANHSLVYTGEKALSLWREWNKRIFKPNNKRKK